MSGLQWVRRVFVSASVAWAGLLPLAPYVVSRPHDSVLLWSFSAAMYGIGAVLCHQLPGRSFHLWSAQLPVCARCTGIYAGAAIGAVTAAFQPRQASSSLPAATSRNESRVVIVLLAVPTIVTLVFEWTTGITPANWIRALAGLPLGAAVAWVVIRVN